MAIRNITYYPAPVLKAKAAAVNEITPAVLKLLTDMAETMYYAEGVGLAAPQISESVRVAVIDVSRGGNSLIELINPTITSRSGKVPSEEGCLSIPGFRETIERSANVTVTALDRNGASFSIEAEGLLAMALQHEIDHLDGILFFEHLSRLKRELFRSWWKREGQAAIEKAEDGI